MRSVIDLSEWDRIMRKTSSGRVAAIASVLAVLGTIGMAGQASASILAYNPCLGDNPPPVCRPTPPKPTPPPPTVDIKTALGPVLHVDKYNAEHVTTTLFLVQRFQRSSGARIGQWLESDYDVKNDYDFQGWHVSVWENVYDTDGFLATATEPHIIGVTPRTFDPDHARVQVSYQKALTPSVADDLLRATGPTPAYGQAHDDFSN